MCTFWKFALLPTEAQFPMMQRILSAKQCGLLAQGGVPDDRPKWSKRAKQRFEWYSRKLNYKHCRIALVHTTLLLWTGIHFNELKLGKKQASWRWILCLFLGRNLRKIKMRCTWLMWVVFFLFCIFCQRKEEILKNWNEISPPSRWSPPIRGFSIIQHSTLSCMLDFWVPALHSIQDSI